MCVELTLNLLFHETIIHDYDDVLVLPLTNHHREQQHDKGLTIACWKAEKAPHLVELEELACQGDLVHIVLVSTCSRKRLT